MPEDSKQNIGALDFTKLRDLIAALAVLASDPNLQQLIAYIIGLFAAKKAKSIGAACPPDCPHCPDGHDAEAIEKVVDEVLAAQAA